MVVKTRGVNAREKSHCQDINRVAGQPTPGELDQFKLIPRLIYRSRRPHHAALEAHPGDRQGYH